MRKRNDETGCRFSLSVMSDGYAGAILGAVSRVSARNVWSGTDALSTVYLGGRAHVVDAVKACFVHANDGRTHVTMEATFSNARADGDEGGDLPAVAPDAELANRAEKKFDVLSKISLYPLGAPNYMDHVSHADALAKGRGVFKKNSRYATELQGDVNDVFACLEEIMRYAEESVAHYVLQATLSANSPSLAGAGQAE